MKIKIWKIVFNKIYNKHIVVSKLKKIISLLLFWYLKTLNNYQF